MSHMVSGKMLGGFNITSIKGHHLKMWGLSPSHSDGVIFLGTTMEPMKCLRLEPEAKVWLNTIIVAYAHCCQVSAWYQLRTEELY